MKDVRDVALDILNEAATAKKSSWKVFISELEQGLAFLGSKFNSSVEEGVEATKRVKASNLYADRILNSGKSRLAMDKLDKKGNVTGSSNLYKSGVVYKYGDFFILYDAKDGDNIMIYGVPKR